VQRPQRKNAKSNNTKRNRVVVVDGRGGGCEVIKGVALGKKKSEEDSL